MRIPVRCLALAAVALLVVPVLAADLDQPAQRVTWTGEIAGLLKKVDSGSLTIQVDVPKVQKQKGSQGNRNRGRRGKGGGNRQPTMPNIRLAMEHKELTLPVAENVVLRVLQPPAGFDEKGNIKKYTTQELRELKGPGNLPGYRGDGVGLRPGQVVKLYLALPKGAAGPNAKPEVVMALIVVDSTGKDPKRQR